MRWSGLPGKGQARGDGSKVVGQKETSCRHSSSRGRRMQQKASRGEREGDKDGMCGNEGNAFQHREKNPEVCGQVKVSMSSCGCPSEQAQKAHEADKAGRPELAPGRDSYRRLWDFFLISFQQRFISRGAWGPAALLRARGVMHKGPAPSCETST